MTCPPSAQTIARRFCARRRHGVDDRAKAIRREDVRQAVEQPGDAGPLAVRRREIRDLHLAAAFVQAHRLQTGEVDRPLGIPAHAAAPFRSTLRSASAV